MVLLRNPLINLALNFNFEKLVKRETSLFNFSKKLLESETPSCGFDRVGLKGGQNSSKRHEFLACMLVYAICIQTYDQVSILRIWSKLRLHLTFLLGFGLKMPK